MLLKNPMRPFVEKWPSFEPQFHEWIAIAPTVAYHALLFD
jgi:hypothetical protein